MQNLSILLVCSFCILGHVSSAGIRIGNELKNKKLLWMRCYSKDDVIGPLIIPIGGHRFNYFAFKLYSASDDGGVWDWRAREDGIYLKIKAERGVN
ncbi:Plant self-incompatibility protein S1 family [Arabidopsis thaliana]|uniref:Plant self-incompatibility protein S1 family n=1 Tax=Arabidopsis thaliana TaxID=3702 RepID=Q1PEL2_ARATH|nr:Plant self-incompatibility protein S1 family [Arabidopsis thaliana]ABE65972.1 self-incompatibility protein-like protein [Arabidopsis thaliana]AEE77225.1 Plant self-incompatibility protein S1 family [Arabidopsis thaliana]|eukprot:NP_189321.2 Plant self-incompatibility protein S1 family [Arabidopsis thaliana]